MGKHSHDENPNGVPVRYHLPDEPFTLLVTDNTVPWPAVKLPNVPGLPPTSPMPVQDR